jgi:hypothetical protein
MLILNRTFAVTGLESRAAEEIGPSGDRIIGPLEGPSKLPKLSKNQLAALMTKSTPNMVSC